MDSLILKIRELINEQFYTKDRLYNRVIQDLCVLNLVSQRIMFEVDCEQEEALRGQIENLSNRKLNYGNLLRQLLDHYRETFHERA